MMGPWLWRYRERSEHSEYDKTPVEAVAHVKQAAHAKQAAQVASVEPSAGLEASAGLLYHPAFRGWFAEGEWLLGPATALLLRMPEASVTTLGNLGLPAGEITDLTRRYLDPSMVERLQNRLRAMGEWLERAGETHPAALARASAQALVERPPEQHVLARAMVELGLQMVVEQLRSL